MRLFRIINQFVIFFKVGIGGNSVSDHGISFGGVSNGEDKLATATMSNATTTS